jgi:hypothetical protein
LSEYVIEHTAVESQLKFASMLPMLPGPGTPAFAKLAKDLHPFGISPSGITVDTPSARLGDVVLTIALLEKRVGLRITAASLEVLINGLFVNDESSLVTIVDAVFDALRTIDPDSVEGIVSHRVTSHMRLVSENVVEFLAKHQPSDTLESGLIVDAIGYKVRNRENIYASEIRLVLAKSLLHQNALFVDWSATYPELVETVTLMSRINSDFDGTLGLMGLVEAKEPNGE